MIGELIKKHNVQVTALENEVQTLKAKISEAIESHKVILDDLKFASNE